MPVGDFNRLHDENFPKKTGKIDLLKQKKLRERFLKRAIKT